MPEGQRIDCLEEAEFSRMVRTAHEIADKNICADGMLTITQSCAPAGHSILRLRRAPSSRGAQLVLISLNGKRETPCLVELEYGVSCKQIGRAGREEGCNKDSSASLGMTIQGNSTYLRRAVFICSV